MTQIGLGIGDILFLLDLAAFITLFFLGRGISVKGGRPSYKPVGLVLLALVVSIAEMLLFGPLGQILVLINFFALLVYFAAKPEHLLGFFSGKSLLTVATISMAGTFLGLLVVYLSHQLVGILPLYLLLFTVGFSAILLSKGLLVSLTAEVLERGGLSRYWAILFSLFGYAGLLVAVLIARRREES